MRNGNGGIPRKSSSPPAQTNTGAGRATSASAARRDSTPGREASRARPDAKALRAYLANSAATIIALLAILVIELAYEQLGWPFGMKEYIEIAGILALTVAFGLFALGRWKELVREKAERGRAEAELNKLSQAVEQSPASVIITDVNGRIEYVNPRFTAVTGYTFDEVAGQNPRILKSGETPRSVYKDLWSTITAGGEWHGEFRNRRKDGEVFWQAESISPIRSPQGAITHFLAVGEDVTERKRAEEDLVRAREQAEAASQAKSEFVANISHEIRTPMNGVVGAIDLLLDTRLEDEQHELAATAKLSADTLLTVINNILDFSEIETGKLTLESVDFSLAEEVREVTALLSARAAEKGLKITSSIPPDLPATVKGDPLRIRQVLINLMDNAIKFTDAGEIRVEIQVTWPSSRRVPVRIAVHDTGIGVPEERQKAIFESFVQANGSTKRRFGGSGLGLAICRRLTEQMGGKMGLESRAGHGSTFWFELNLGKASPSRARIQSQRHNGAARTRNAGRGLRVLLVEDNPVNRRVVLKLLQRNHVVDAVADGRQALEMISENDYDAVLMDVQMPEMDGFEVTAEIRRREAETGGHLPVIAMTAHAMKGDRERCLSHGMDDYLSKPVTGESLTAILSAWAPAHRDAHPRADRVALAAPADLGEVRRISAGDDGFMRELIGEFLSYTPGLLSQLRVAVSAGERTNAEGLAHAIRGSCRILGAQALANACLALEAAARNGRPKHLTPHLADVERQYEHLQKYLTSATEVRAS